MFQVRVQGRYDKEVRNTAELLAAAARAEGRRAVASAASAAGPAVSLCTIDGPATEPAAAADGLILQDAGELRRRDVFARLSQEAYVLVNSACGFGDLGVSDRIERFCRDRVLIVPAARFDLGLHQSLTRSASMLGGFAALSRVVSLDSVASAIREKMPESVGWACEEAAEAAYDFVLAEKQALAA